MILIRLLFSMVSVGLGAAVVIAFRAATPVGAVVLLTAVVVIVGMRRSERRLRLES
jgi:hypothetical protein